MDDILKQLQLKNMMETLNPKKSSGKIIIVIIIIVIVLAVLIGGGIGLFFWITGEPSDPAKCDDKKTFGWYDNGKESCCYTKPKGWSRFGMKYTECPIKSPYQGNCPVDKYEFKDGCCNEKPTEFDIKTGKFNKCSSVYKDPISISNEGYLYGPGFSGFAEATHKMIIPNGKIVYMVDEGRGNVGFVKMAVEDNSEIPRYYNGKIKDVKSENWETYTLTNPGGYKYIKNYTPLQCNTGYYQSIPNPKSGVSACSSTTCPGKAGYTDDSCNCACIPLPV